MRVTYAELDGELRPGPMADAEARREPLVASVVRSNITSGEAVSSCRPGITLSYVGRGIEHYRIAGRHYRIGEDQFMISPQAIGSEICVRRGEDRAGVLGLCIYLPFLGEHLRTMIADPIVLPADCALGQVLKDSLRELSAAVAHPQKPVISAARALALVEPTLAMLDRQMANLPRTKSQTRFETMRRMNLARAYLHDVINRAVPLEELAREVGTSPFHLLRNFRDCFGVTPSVYHRRHRLALAHQFAAEEGLTYDFVADRFGFAGGSSFNHAFKRTFGVTPRHSPGLRERLQSR